MRSMILAVGCAIAASSVAHAAPLTVSASQGNLAASATFESSGFNIIVTLTNTSTADVMAPADVLTGVFFDVASLSNPLTRVSAILPSGSVVLFGTAESGGSVGGEWAYRSGLSGAPRGAAYGISSSGLNLFGPGDLFPGGNLQGPDSPDGIQYGITSAGDNPATGNTPVTGTNALIKNRVVFTLSGLPTGFNPATAIRNVSFQYGTALNEPNIPAPGALALASVGLLGLRRRRA